MAITATGLASSLDVNSLVSQLMQTERQPVVALQKRTSQFQTQLSAYGKVKSALSTFQTALDSLATPSAIKALASSSSDATIASATTTAAAAAGSYVVDVQQLAQQHKLSSSSFVSANETVGSGALTIQLGTYTGGVFTPNAAKPAASVTIAAENATLSGIRDAVNAARSGVTASLINDGNGYRLVMTAADGGTANSIRITASDADGIDTDMNGLSQLAYDPAATSGSGKNLSLLSTAQNALVTIDGITLNQGTNVISGAVDGVTLSLGKVGTATVTVAQDAARTAAAVKALATAYNDLDKTLRELTAYNAQTKSGGPLLGDSTVRRLHADLRSALGGSVAGRPEGMNALSHIGVRFQSDGKLAVDETKLNAALASDFSGAAAILAATGQASDSLVRWTGAGSKTQSGIYALSVTQVASQGSLAGDAAAGLVISAGVNDTLDLIVDGTAISVTLAAGTYGSAGVLAAALQSTVNGDGALQQAGSAVTVGESGGILTITSNRYGSASSVTTAGGSGATGLFGAAPASSSGVNVAGTINGAAATGSGQLLTAAVGNAAEGLRVQVGGGGTGARGTIAYSIGTAALLDRLVDSVVASDGSISGRVGGIESSIKQLGERQKQIEERLTAVEARYRAQFVSLDGALSRMTTTSSFLQSQLSSLL